MISIGNIRMAKKLIAESVSLFVDNFDFCYLFNGLRILQELHLGVPKMKKFYF